MRVGVLLLCRPFGGHTFPLEVRRLEIPQLPGHPGWVVGERWAGVHGSVPLHSRDGEGQGPGPNTSR